MKSLRTYSSAGCLVLALLAAFFAVATASAGDSKGGLRSWDNLKSLSPGQEIRVVMNNVKSYEGKFESSSNAGITLRQAAGEQTLARQDVLRVSWEKGHNHRVRNAVIGAAAGAGVGLGLGVAYYLRPRNCTEGPLFRCEGPSNLDLAKILTPAGGGIGAAIGAALPTGGWRDVYRAR